MSLRQVEEDRGNEFLCILKTVLSGGPMLLVDNIEQDESWNQSKLTGTIAHPSRAAPPRLIT